MTHGRTLEIGNTAEIQSCSCDSSIPGMATSLVNDQESRRNKTRGVKTEMLEDRLYKYNGS